MPFNDQEIADAGLAVLDHFVRNKPIDQISVERVFLKEMMANKKEVPAAKQYVTEQLRTNYGANFQWFNGAQIVTYNRRQTLAQTQFPWRSAHDGVAIDEDRLIQHGVTVTDKGPGGMASDSEIDVLTDLLSEQMESLRNGFEERFSKYLHLNGTFGGADVITGLDALVAVAPSSGTVGGINRATAGNTYWRNQISGTLTTVSISGTILDGMELTWRNCTRNGGRPNKIIMGSAYFDGFRNFMIKTYGKMDYGQVGFKKVETGTEMITFHGVPMEWAPEWSELDSEFGGSPVWENRCYFLNTNYLKLRPMKGQDVKTRTPPRPYDRYEYYWALTWRGALTMGRSNCHGMLNI